MDLRSTPDVVVTNEVPGVVYSLQSLLKLLSESVVINHNVAGVKRAARQNMSHLDNAGRHIEDSASSTEIYMMHFSSQPAKFNPRPICHHKTSPQLFFHR
jgi:alpha-glucuronidase